MFDKKRLQAQMVLKDIKAEELSEKLGINPSTFYRKMNNDGDFSRVEIEKMILILDIADPVFVFFNNNA